jgi:hypothetical protein
MLEREDMIYCAIICDMKKSRTLSNWSSIVERLEQVLISVNSKFQGEISIDFKLTVGDEFQGVLKTPKSAYDVYVYLKSNLPVEIYCGIGVGDIERVNKNDKGLRGTAFYRAREALQFCKKKKRFLFLKSGDGERQLDDIINTVFHFIEVIEKSWTRRQREIVSYCRLHPDFTYEKIGVNFGISKQSVSQILKSANWQVILEGEALIKKLLMNFVKQNHFTNDSKANILYSDRER